MGPNMEKQELVKTLWEREEYLEGEWYQLLDLADKMGGLVALQESDPLDAEDLLKALTATRKALKAVRRMIDRNK